jgi:hypothetical protein
VLNTLGETLGRSAGAVCPSPRPRRCALGPPPQDAREPVTAFAAETPERRSPSRPAGRVFRRTVARVADIGRENMPRGTMRCVPA